jgi:hypothetical protein
VFRTEEGFHSLLTTISHAKYGSLEGQQQEQVTKEAEKRSILYKVRYCSQTMEAALQDIQSKKQKQTALTALTALTAAEDANDDANNAATLSSSSSSSSLLQALASALQAALPLLSCAAATTTTTTTTVSAAWLMQLLETTLPSQEKNQLGTFYLAQQVVFAASHFSNEQQQQAAFLFDVLGESEAAMQVLLEIMPHMADIAQHVSLDHLAAHNNHNHHHHNNHNNNTSLQTQQQQTSPLENATLVDLEMERREFLRREYMDAAQVVAIAEMEVQALLQPQSGLCPSSSGGGGISAAGANSGTHTISRTSEKQALKFLEKSQRRAAQALQRAQDAGAILDQADLIQVNTTGFGSGGLAGLHNQQEAWASLQTSLLPEGSKQYYDRRGLPAGTIQSDGDGYVKVWIPPAILDTHKLHPRLNIADIMDDSQQQGLAFSGTATLNPMQSSVFQLAFHHRDNLLICAPTGAGYVRVLIYLFFFYLTSLHEHCATVLAACLTLFALFVCSWLFDHVGIVFV